MEGNSLFVKHRKQHTPAPHLGACVLKHQCGALSSMLSFIKSSILSLSVVLGPLPPVSSPPEHDANFITILLSSLLSKFSGVLRLPHLSLDLLEMVKNLIWSIAPYLRACQSLSDLSWREKVEMREKREGEVPIKKEEAACVCSSGLDPVKPLTFLWFKRRGGRVAI